MFIANKVDAPPVISKDLIRAHDKEVTRSTKYSFRTRTTSYYSRIVLGTTAQWRYSVEHIWLPIKLVYMVREGLLVLSDSRISKDDVCAAIEHLCVEWRCNCHVFFAFLYFFCFSFCFSFVFILILYFVYDIDNNVGWHYAIFVRN